MNSELVRVRWLTFAALCAVAGIFLLPAIRRGDANSVPLGGLIILAAWLVAWAFELWVKVILQRAPRVEPVPALLDSDKIFELNRKFILAAHPQDVLEAAMAAACDVIAAAGCSFVPYDEWGRGLPALVRGDVPAPEWQRWAERLSAPGTRQACKTCKSLAADGDCVLLCGTEHASASVRCITLRQGERELGVFNFYFDSKHGPLTDPERGLLTQIMASASAALQTLQEEASRMSARHEGPGSTAQRAALTGLLEGLLSNLQKTLDVAGASFWIPGGSVSASHRALFLSTRSRGESDPGAALPDGRFVQGLWESIAQTRQPVHFSNISLKENELWHALSAFPLMWNDDVPLGILLVASTRSFSAEQLSLLQIVAGEAALIVMNARYLVEAEYQAVLDERARLAREIHDGLAQTLAFLKMQSDQMQIYLAQGQMDRLNDTLRASSRTLNDAYLDARQAIDNLRRLPDMGLAELLRRTADEFFAAANISVDVTGIAPLPELPLNLRAQLLRIVQEALANVRKHARAKCVALAARLAQGDLILEVRDDGVGFAPEMVAAPTQYGLRGMRERAEMIGAEFQVISRPGEGTTVRLQIPIEVGEAG